MSFLQHHEILQNMFMLGIPILEKIVRPILVYLALVVLLRLFGKRELAQLNQFDLVVLLSLSNTVQNAIIGEDNTVLGGIIGAFTLLAFNYLMVRVLFKHKNLEQLLEGKRTVLIQDGKLRKAALGKELLTIDDLVLAAHRQGYRNLKEISSCVLEPGGVIFFESKEPTLQEQRYHDVIGRLAHMEEMLSKLVKTGEAAEAAGR